ncbi:response regulator transcription factor [Paraburkholderia phytofirmans]|uniref:Response regulator receiver protein n=1 Tax=Paraburkholderia phytofirmans (strain DSM 17436 / LMG 22146 / PsJN) TaxID=398527 RepID=B2T973_PARPJ|nr:response regulator [Paraburkholderia phytofirmans]ACD20975.1 response regulator receiver protein [Paraburkholderia phytofirmans PsJN]
MNQIRQLIVVVEDDAGMGRALQRLLTVSGFDILVFDSAEAYVGASRMRVPHCLVLDVQLPGVSGPRLYEQLRYPRPPVVFITSHDDPATRNAVASAGGQELLIKPFVARDLLDAISRVAPDSGTR